MLKLRQTSSNFIFLTRAADLRVRVHAATVQTRPGLGLFQHNWFRFRCLLLAALPAFSRHHLLLLLFLSKDVLLALAVHCWSDAGGRRRVY